MPAPRRAPVGQRDHEPGAVPRLVIELTSVSSVRYDLGEKRELYESLGVEEYVVFDVLRDSGRQPVRLWRLEHGRFVEQATLESQVLGVRLHAQDWRLRLVAPDGVALPSPLERAAAAAERAEAEAARAEAEAVRREEAEAALAQALERIRQLEAGGQDP